MSDRKPAIDSIFFRDFEPRWFRFDAVCVVGDLVALEEWIDGRDRSRCQKRIVVFNATTGEELRSEDFMKLETVDELKTKAQRRS